MDYVFSPTINSKDVPSITQKKCFEKESHYWELFLVAPDELDFTYQFFQSFLAEIASLAYQVCKVPVVGYFFSLLM